MRAVFTFLIMLIIGALAEGLVFLLVLEPTGLLWTIPVGAGCGYLVRIARLLRI